MIIQQFYKEHCNRQQCLESIYLFLDNINNEYNPPLSAKVDLRQYTEKIFDNAVLFVRNDNSNIVGMVVLYCNDENKEKAYIPLVGVLPSHRRRGIAKELMQEAISYVKSKDFNVIGIHSNNPIAVKAYCDLGFDIIEDGERKYMEMKIK